MTDYDYLMFLQGVLSGLCLAAGSFMVGWLVAGIYEWITQGADGGPEK